MTIGTSNTYKQTLFKTIKNNGIEVYGIIEYLDCEDNSIGIFNIDGYIERVDLKNECLKYVVGDSLLFYGYKKKYILATFKVSNTKIVFPLIFGIIIMYFGIRLTKRTASA